MQRETRDQHPRTARLLNIKPYILRLYLAAFALFVLNKLLLRPFVLEHGSSQALEVLVLSAPNLFEAILGVSNVTALLMLVRSRLGAHWKQVPDRSVYVLATSLAGVYVLTQEFKLHNLGGNNIFDPNDVLASILGLLGMVSLFWRYGFRACEGS